MLELVCRDKLQEVCTGYDGMWAAHPGLIPTIQEVFEGHLGGRSNKIDAVVREDVPKVTVEDLIQPPQGARTVEGMSLNTRVGVQYLVVWLVGSRSVLLYNLMEDATTTEISCMHNWQWQEEMARVEVEVGADKFHRGQYAEVGRIFS